MFKIKEFSRLTHVPIKTLRYYDELGLFVPTRVDAFTGYRYYDASQLPRLYQLLALRALGMPLEQIKAALAADITTSELHGMLRLKQAEIQQQITDWQERMTHVNTLITQIEEETDMSYSVILKTIPSFTVVAKHGVAADQPSMGPLLVGLFQELAAYVAQNGGKLSTNPEELGITIYHDKEWTGKDIHVEAIFGIQKAIPTIPDIHVYELPAVETMASVVHTGSFDTLGVGYDALTRWIGANGYEICGPNREINIKFDPQGNPAEWVTELQFPVRKM
jgi:DNA-binding transcriptional MerR regulator